MYDLGQRVHAGVGASGTKKNGGSRHTQTSPEGLTQSAEHRLLMRLFGETVKGRAVVGQVKSPAAMPYSG